MVKLWRRTAIICAILGGGCAKSMDAPSMEGRYVLRLEMDTTTLDFNPDGSVMIYPLSIRSEWKRSRDTVFVSGFGAQTLVMQIRGDSLVSNLGLVFLRDRAPGKP